MDDDIRFDPGDMKFTFGWCELCQAVFVRCPKCGNNTCNGGSGTLPDGKRCDMCGAAYQYDKLFRRTGCELCDHWRKADGGFCFLTRNFPEVHPCSKFTGIIPSKEHPMSPQEEKLLKDIFGEENAAVHPMALECERCGSNKDVNDTTRTRTDCESDEDYEEWKDEPIALCSKCMTDRASGEEKKDGSVQG